MTTAIDHPPDLWDPAQRHLVVLAHQDDELPYAGLLSRMPNVRVVFVTNGDGLAHESEMEPEPYAALRQSESERALDEVGIASRDIRWLGFSELAIYQRLAVMSLDREGEVGVPPLFNSVAERVAAEVEDFDPTVVWTLAWQGGHPEHDLTHLAAVCAVRALEGRRGGRVPIFELPAYELIVVAMRFRPWVDRVVHEIRLTAEELAAKERMMGMYPTQARVIGEFRSLIGTFGRLSALVGRPFEMRDFASREVFAPVPSERDYTRSTHLSPRLDYPFDDYKGTPIRFDRTLARVAQAWCS